jgi:hypothetical protein
VQAGASELAGQAILVLPMAAVAFAGQRLFVFDAPQVHG